MNLNTSKQINEEGKLLLTIEFQQINVEEMTE